MADRRMISKKIVCTDKFLAMPDKAKVAYFYLLLSADDDGFIGNAKAILSMCNLTPKSAAPLIENGFLIHFPSGVFAVSHWKLQNRVAKDRYTPTIYLSEKEILMLSDSEEYILNG